jgi:protein TonB
MQAVQSRAADRLKAAMGTAALQGLLGYALIVGLSPDLPVRIASDLKIFDITPEPPRREERTVPAEKRTSKPEGAASPPNLRAKPTEIVKPPPVVPLVIPPPIVASPKPGTGNDSSAGASNIPGPGTGSGGEGTGTGSGGAGEGEGGGGGTPARWVRGRIRDSDYPSEASRTGTQGSLTTRYVIGPTGRITDCTVIKSSGSAVLDETTCRLVMQRYRYEPARDAQGRRVSDTDVEEHSWVLVD